MEGFLLTGLNSLTVQDLMTLHYHERDYSNAPLTPYEISVII